MNRAQARFLKAANALVVLTGLALGWALFFAEPADDFAVVNHPWQPEFLHAHVLSAPLFVFAVGLIFERHVWLRVRNGHRAGRRSGLGLFALLLPMVLSGYALQVCESLEARSAWSWVHVVTSVLWLLAWIAHQVAAHRAEAG